MIAWMVGSALGATVEAGVGLETAVAAPQIVARGVTGTLSARWGAFGATVLGAFDPDLGSSAYTAHTRALVERNGVAPEASRTLGRVAALAEVTAAGPSGPVTPALHLGVGPAVVATRDDLELAQRQDDPAFLAAESEFHPAAAGSAAFDLGVGAFTLRARATALTYRETFGSGAQGVLSGFVGAEFVARLR